MTQGLTPRLDTIAATNTYNSQQLTGIQSTLTAGVQDFVDETELILVPNTSIIGRALIPNIAKDLKPSLGIERISTEQLYVIPNEIGASGEIVYGVVNDTKGLIRCTGIWYLANQADAAYPLSGSRIQTWQNSTSSIEIVFYGTGLNMLVSSLINNASYSLDGGSNVAISSRTQNAAVNRGYTSNSVQPIVHNLTLGIHTVKISITAGGSGYIWCSGFEIVNSNASGLININPGTAYYQGSLYSKAIADSVNYNASTYTFTCSSANATVDAIYTNNGQTFTVLSTIASGTVLYCKGTGAPSASGTLTKTSGTGDSTITFSAYTPSLRFGGRVLQYLKTDGTIGQAISTIPSSASYLNSASHTNEEMVRTYHWQEFGCGRNSDTGYSAPVQANDDFSTLTATNRDAQFTLDDGGTSLVSTSVSRQIINVKAVVSPVLSTTLGFTFTGCGVDVEFECSSFTGTLQYSIDQASFATITNLPTIGGVSRIASGLPYGTHTLRLNMSSSGGSIGILSYRVYQPIKPTVPTGEIVIADYNLLATYVACAVSGGFDALWAMSRGVIAKESSRELDFQTPWLFSKNPAEQRSYWGTFAFPGQFQSFYYTFFGTGFDLRFPFYNDVGGMGTGATNIQGYLRNRSTGGSELTLTTSNFSFTSSTYGVTGKFNASTGVLDQSHVSVLAGGLSISGLPLGLYTLRFYINTGAGFFRVGGVDVITPIHSYKSNLYSDSQNTLSIGSNSLLDSRKTNITKDALPATKARAQASGVTSNITCSATTAIPIVDLAATIKTSSNGYLDISFFMSFRSNLATNAYFAIYVDGVMLTPGTNASPIQSDISASQVSVGSQIASYRATCPVSAGTHTVHVTWNVGGGGATLTATGQKRTLTVIEI